MITVIGILTGAVLGTRYKVLCLIPITLVAAGGLAVLGRVNGMSAGSIALSALALAVGLQIGYLAGATIRSVLRVALASSVNEPARLRDQPARIS